MPFAVFLRDDAVRDLDELYDYIALHDAPHKRKIFGPAEVHAPDIPSNSTRVTIPAICVFTATRFTERPCLSFIVRESPPA
jgi:hypothetical protein